MMDWLSAPEHAKWVDLGIALGGRLVGALVLLLIGLRLARMLAAWLGTRLQNSKLESTAAMFLSRVVFVVLQVVLLLAVVQVLGVPMASMLAVLGAAGLAIGLAMKDSLSNIASGVMLVTLTPFRVRDVVTINGMSGTVEAVSIFQTQLRGADNQLITLPNSLITSDSIINLTPGTMRRIEIVVRIGYSSDIDLARSIAMELMLADSRILAEPKPSVLVYELAETGVNLGIRCHTANADHFDTRCALLESLKKRYDEGGVDFPLQHELRIIADNRASDGSGKIS